MTKLLLIATLSLTTVAWAQPMADDMDNTQSADQDFYSQNVSVQADLNTRILDANRLIASSQSESWSASEEPGSMAADTGAQNTDEDFYDQTVAIQANVNRLLADANRQQ
jgi:hypothetical protein